MKSYPNSFTTDEFETSFSSEQILMMFLDDENMCGDTDGKLTVIENPSERMKAVKEFAKKHNGQIYTEVDLDTGKTGYSKGVRICNIYNQGLYTVVKVKGLEIDNS